eukprot:12768359-Ditylum_brightwellii.AAC.1
MLHELVSKTYLLETYYPSHPFCWFKDDCPRNRWVVSGFHGRGSDFGRGHETVFPSQQDSNRGLYSSQGFDQ